MTVTDYIALALFVLLWLAYARITGNQVIWQRTSLTKAMAERRREWILNSMKRDLKMIDTQILSGLQNGTAFFASTSIFAIGGCFALLGQTEVFLINRYRGYFPADIAAQLVDAVAQLAHFVI